MRAKKKEKIAVWEQDLRIIRSAAWMAAGQLRHVGRHEEADSVEQALVATVSMVGGEDELDG